MVQLLYKMTALDKADWAAFFTRWRYFVEGERTGHIFVVIANSQMQTNFFSSILTPAGVISHEQEDTLHSFCSFYGELYQSKVDYQMAQLRQFLAPLNVSSLSPSSRKSLNAPLTLD